MHKIFLFSLFFFYSVAYSATNSKICSKQFGNDKLIEVIEPSAELFANAKKNVKEKFVGQEAAIESVFAQMETWYLHPETRKSPVIIPLFGMTGTGKTSLIKEIITELHLEREFFYFDMDKFSGADSKTQEMNFANELSQKVSQKEKYGSFELETLVTPKNPIIMLDEFQKINTKKEGKSESQSRPLAQPIWEMLGNSGKLIVSNPTFEKLRTTFEYPESHLPIPSHIKYGPEKELKEKMKSELLMEAQEIYERTPPQATLNLEGGLFFIGANLDNVFKKSKVSDPESVSANELNVITKNITVSEVKDGLLELFRPEHVARLGSRFVVFPTFSEKSFKEVISKRLDDIKEMAFKHYKIRVEYTENLKERIYQEGVIPSQGIRPLIQTIDTFAVDPLSRLHSEKVKEDFYTNRRKLKVVVDVENGSDKSIWKIENGPLKGKEFLEVIPSEYVITSNLRAEPARSIVAVRLAASIVTGIKFYKKIPEFVRANSRVKNRDGIINFNLEENFEVDNTFALREYYLDQMAHQLAGYVAEKMVFGETGFTSRNELKIASSYAKTMAGEAGMGMEKKATIMSDDLASKGLDMHYEANAILAEAMSRARDLIAQEKVVFTKLVGALTTKVDLTNREIQNIVGDWTNKEFVEMLLKNPNRQISKEEALVSDLLKDSENFEFKDVDKPTKIGF